MRAFLLVLLLGAAPSIAAAAGAAAFATNCSGCHMLSGKSTPNGPSLKGVVWRKIAVLNDFRYTPSLRSLVGTWSPDRLDAFLKDTQGFAPGTDMFFDVRDDKARREIIDYLTTVK